MIISEDGIDRNNKRLRDSAYHIQPKWRIGQLAVLLLKSSRLRHDMNINRTVKSLKMDMYKPACFPGCTVSRRKFAPERAGVALLLIAFLFAPSCTKKEKEPPEEYTAKVGQMREAVICDGTIEPLS